MKFLCTALLLLLCAPAVRGQFLSEKVYNIEAVTVDKRAEDRAYRVMRNAIARAPYHARQVAEYDAEVYLKGSFDIVKISRAMRAMMGEDAQTFKEGDTFTEESWNEIKFTAPDRYDQRVVKKLSSMPDGGDDVEAGAMRLVNINIYDMGMVGNLIVSPLSPGAFSHYRFRYEGYTEDRGHIIDKISVTPRRRSQQLVSGHIYIAEGSWSVHGLDLAGHMRIMAGIGFRLQTAYDEKAPDVWMPTSHRINFDVKILNSQMDGRYTAAVDYSRVVENAEVKGALAALSSSSAPANASAPKTTAASSSASKSAAVPVAPPAALPGGDEKPLSNRDAYRLARRADREVNRERRARLDVTEEFDDKVKITVDTLALAPDPEFWERVRPVALEPSELKGYRDRGVKAGADSTARDTTKTGTPIAVKLLAGMGSKPLKLGKRGGELVWHGVMPSREGFNTVDGWYFGFSPVEWRRDFGEVKTAGGATYPAATLAIRPEATWAIARHTAMWNVRADLKFAPMRRGELELVAGSESRDFSGREGGIHTLENTVASILFRRNYMKLYGEKFVEGSAALDLANGLRLTLDGKLSRRRGLENNSGYSLFYRGERTYTPNFSLPDHTAAIVSAELSYTPRQKYRLVRGRKEAVRSSWPTFTVEWRKGLRGIMGSTVEFDHVSAAVGQGIVLAPGQMLRYSVRAGGFTGRRGMHFPDFHHFTTGDIPLTNRSMNSGGTFHLLPYYHYSTDGGYLQAHAGYHARYLLIKLLPWFSDRLWMEGVQINYMKTARMPNYTELGYTIGMLVQAGVFVGFEGARYRSVGVKLSIPLAFSGNGVSLTF